MRIGFRRRLMSPRRGAALISGSAPRISPMRVRSAAHELAKWPRGGMGGGGAAAPRGVLLIRVGGGAIFYLYYETVKEVESIMAGVASMFAFSRTRPAASSSLSGSLARAAAHDATAASKT